MLNRFAVILVICLLAQAVLLPAQAQNARLISAAAPSQSANLAGAGPSFAPVVSSGARYVAFASFANNLAEAAPGTPYHSPSPSVLNVYLRDRNANTTRLISVNQSGTGGGNGNSLPTAVDTTGRYVLFESEASNLVDGDTNNTWDVFVRDTIANTTLLVSANPNGVPGNQASDTPSMTPDGRYVAFVSSATDLVAGDTNQIPDIFVRDLQTRRTTIASPGAAPSAGAINISDAPFISADGRYVAFYSTASRLVNGAPGTGDIYVRDLTQATTIWASTNGRPLAASVGVANATCFGHAFAANGQFVAYQAGNVVLRYSLADRTTDLIYTGAATASLSGDYSRNLDISTNGGIVVFVAQSSGSSYGNSIQIWNAHTKAVTSASANLANITQCASPVIDAAGKMIAFLAGSSDQCDLYSTDLSLGAARKIDTFPDNTTLALDFSCLFNLSADGRSVVFDYANDNLLSTDLNGTHDVFVSYLPGGTLDLISLHQADLPSSAPNGFSSLTSRSVAKNGRRIAFVSNGNNLVAGDTNSNYDVFVRDLDLGSNILVSVSSDGRIGNGRSWDPAISSDGRFVAFTSQATNLVANDTNKSSDVFVRDTVAGTTTLASLNRSYNSSDPQISADGRYVLFLGQPSSGSANQDLYLRDLQAQVTWSVAKTVYYTPCMTPDARYIAYSTSPTSGQFKVWDTTKAGVVFSAGSSNATYSDLGLSPDGKWALSCDKNNLLLSDLVAQTSKTLDTTTTSGGFASFHFSDDGRRVTYVKSQTNPRHGGDIYLCDLQRQTTELASHAVGSTNVGAASSAFPQISADGRFIAYQTRASNIVTGHTNGLPVIALYDSQTQSNQLLSASRFGDIMDRSLTPVFSGDSRNVVFQSWNTSLSPSALTYGLPSDVFLVPMLYASVSTGSGSSGSLISWPSVPGTTYQAQYTENLATPDWLPLAGEFTQQNDTLSIQDNAPTATTRFYRIVQW